MTTIFNEYKIGLCHLCCKMSNFSILLQAYNGRGHVTGLTSDDMYEDLRHAVTLKSVGIAPFFRAPGFQGLAAQPARAIFTVSRVGHAANLQKPWSLKQGNSIGMFSRRDAFKRDYTKYQYPGDCYFLKDLSS